MPVRHNFTLKRDAEEARRHLAPRWAKESTMRNSSNKVRFLALLSLLSLSVMANANERNAANDLSRLSPRDFPALPAQVASALIELGCTVPQASYFVKGKSNVKSGSFAKLGQKDYAVLCSKNGASHIQVVWGGKTRCKSE